MKIIVTKKEIVKDDGVMSDCFECFCDKPLDFDSLSELQITGPRLIKEYIHDHKNNFIKNEIEFIEELLNTGDLDNYKIILAILENK